MTLFGQSTTFGQTTNFGGMASTNPNPNKDVEVTSPPNDSISCMRFSPGTIQTTLLLAGSWDNNVRCWEIQLHNGQSVPKAEQTMTGPILDVCWHEDGTKAFMASADKQVKVWDLASNQTMTVAAHDAPIKVCRWVKASNYEALMTGSWDKTVKFWDTRSPNPIMSIDVGERVYAADVDYPMAVVGTAGRGLRIYDLENQPKEYKRVESPLKYQHRCISIFRDKSRPTAKPTGFALGSVEGRVAIQYAHTTQEANKFTFKCHRSNGVSQGIQDIYAVNDIAFHPVHGTLATVGSDGKWAFWDKDARTKLKTGEAMEQAITCCSFNATGMIFAYAVSYDWSKGHEYFQPQKKNHIFLRHCYEDLKPRATNK